MLAGDVHVRLAATSELDAAVALASTAIEPQWRLGPGALRRALADALVAEVDGDIVGLCALHQAGDVATINLVAVRPDHRRRGIGRAMVGHAADDLRARGAQSIRAAGSGPYLWPGIPRDLAGASAFAEACGWVRDGEVCDMTRTLADFSLPSSVMTSMDAMGIALGLATASERDQVARIAPTHWYRGWDAYFAASQPADVVVARDAHQQVVAALIIGRPGDPEGWRRMLGNTVCTIGCVGTTREARGQGFGTALVGVASEILRDAGGTVCHIGWTTLLDFYGRLGYRSWRTYTTAGMAL